MHLNQPQFSSNVFGFAVNSISRWHASPHSRPKLKNSLSNSDGTPPTAQYHPQPILSTPPGLFRSCRLVANEAAKMGTVAIIAFACPEVASIS